MIIRTIRSALEEYLEHRKRLRLIKSFGLFKHWRPNVHTMRRSRNFKTDIQKWIGRTAGKFPDL